jgi:hypothetical protein
MREDYSAIFFACFASTFWMRGIPATNGQFIFASDSESANAGDGVAKSEDAGAGSDPQTRRRFRQNSSRDKKRRHSWQ